MKNIGHGEKQMRIHSRKAAGKPRQGLPVTQLGLDVATSRHAKAQPARSALRQEGHTLVTPRKGSTPSAALEKPLMDKMVSYWVDAQYQEQYEDMFKKEDVIAAIKRLRYELCTHTIDETKCYSCKQIDKILGKVN